MTVGLKGHWALGEEGSVDVGRSDPGATGCVCRWVQLPTRRSGVALSAALVASFPPGVLFPSPALLQESGFHISDGLVPSSPSGSDVTKTQVWVSG